MLAMLTLLSGVLAAGVQENVEEAQAPVSGFTPQVSEATPGTAQHVAGTRPSSGLEEQGTRGQCVGSELSRATGPGRGVS